MIRWLRLKNFRSLRDTRIEFNSPFTALIGANNTGKSAVVIALDILRRLMNGSLSSVFQGQYAYTFVHSNGATGPIEFEVCVEYADSDGTTGLFEYRVSIFTSEPTGWLRVGEEVLTQIKSSGTRRIILHRTNGKEGWSYLNERRNVEEEFFGDPIDLGIFQLRDMIAHHSIQQFRLAINSLWIFDLQPRSMKAAAQIVPNATLEWDGSNIAAVLDTLGGEHRKSFDALSHDLSGIIPEIANLKLKTVDGSSKFLAFNEKGVSGDVLSFQASDGVLRAVAMLAALHSPQQPNVLVFEEPENGIHPRRQDLLVDRLRQYTKAQSKPVQRQVIITTHSPYLLDSLDPNEVLIVSRNESGTRVEPIANIEHVRHSMEDSSLGEIWHRGSIGGVPNP